MYKNVNTISDEFLRTHLQWRHSTPALSINRWRHYHWQVTRLLCKYITREVLM